MMSAQSTGQYMSYIYSTCAQIQQSSHQHTDSITIPYTNTRTPFMQPSRKQPYETRQTVYLNACRLDK